MLEGITKVEYLIMSLVESISRRDLIKFLKERNNWENHEQTANWYFNNLIRKGILERKARGKYVLTEAGHCFLRAIKLRENKK